MRTYAHLTKEELLRRMKQHKSVIGELIERNNILCSCGFSEDFLIHIKNRIRSECGSLLEIYKVYNKF